MNCLNCDRIIQENITLRELFSWQSLTPEILCKECRRMFISQKIDKNKGCKICHAFGEESICDECLEWRNIYGCDYQHHSCFYYNKFFSEWLERFKRQGDYVLGQIFAKEIARAVIDIHPDLVVPMPSATAHLAERGFNQVAVMLEFAGVSYIEPLVMTESSGSQSKKTREERLRAIINFELKEDYRSVLTQRSILLVDDVYTTGTTLHRAAHALAPYVKKIETFSLCR
ncbi:ComF family protein [Vagococcus zengguangii]|uniref:ComF family protein n=1 Tax=Vagococcus zengguangii TaxID=2571750 RepID=A0A4D7CTK9_9ENTE|nr:phosphoribosyltransferase family protein [Vagococcus zengguangii]QCI86543.1 ComF family protein [Vagococcus zengguangii]TLG81207.1 ComF family protein [Vagococcus zengguangii]